MQEVHRGGRAVDKGKLKIQNEMLGTKRHKRHEKVATEGTEETAKEDSAVSELRMIWKKQVNETGFPKVFPLT